MRIPLALLVIMAASSPASAELIQRSPKTVCPVLADHDLKGRPWFKTEDGEEGCASDYNELGQPPVPQPNDIAFYATGWGGAVDEVELVVNYFQPKSTSVATSALVLASRSLAERELGAPLSESLIKLIQDGKPGKERLGSGEVEVVREKWQRAKGYEVHVQMR